MYTRADSRRRNSRRQERSERQRASHSSDLGGDGRVSVSQPGHGIPQQGHVTVRGDPHRSAPKHILSVRTISKSGRHRKARSVLVADCDVFRTHKTTSFVEEPVVQVQSQVGPGVRANDGSSKIDSEQSRRIE